MSTKRTERLARAIRALSVTDALTFVEFTMNGYNATDKLIVLQRLVGFSNSVLEEKKA